VLARNSGHFAPFSWYRWHQFHLRARDLIARSATADGAERETLRQRARLYAGYADHFLQDSFAAGHLVNKTLVIQWFIEWLAEQVVSYPGREVLETLTMARQPLLHGPGH
jgi:predicted transcriptional regulator